MPKKLFFYNLPANLVDYFDISKCFMISECKLPEPSKEYDLCAVACERIPKNIPLGSAVQIAAGDPIILEKETKLLSRKIKSTDPSIPEDVKRLGRKYESSDHWKIDTFEYKGRRVWVLDDFVCLLQDLKEADKKLKERRKS